MSPAERSLVVGGFNATDAAPSGFMHREQTVHGALEHWAAVQPDALALVCEARPSFMRMHGQPAAR